MESIIQLVNPKDLVAAIDESIDRWIDEVDGQDFVSFLKDRFDECAPSFKGSVSRNGVKVPVEVGISRHKKPRFYMGNGHHRLSVAYFKNIEEVPVLFRPVRDLEHFSWNCVEPQTYDDNYVNAEGYKAERSSP